MEKTFEIIFISNRRREKTLGKIIDLRESFYKTVLDFGVLSIYNGHAEG